MEIESTLIDQLDIFIHSTSLPYLKEKEVRGIRCLRVFLDVDRECATYQEVSQTIIKALSSTKDIKFEVGKRVLEKEMKGVHDWTRFLGGADKATTNLSILLGDNIISRGQLSQIGGELFKLNHLEQLELQFGSENNMGIGGMKQIGQSIKNMKQLKNLDIVIGDNCNLGEDGAKQLFQGIEDCQNIEKLKLIIGNRNQLNAEGTYAISSTIGKLKKIRDLELNIAETNSLGVKGVKGIIADILQQKQMKKVIERLSLKIGDRRGTNTENIISLFQSLTEFTRLKDLSFDLGVKGEMKEQTIQIINDSLKQLNDLQSIQISICSDPYPFVVSPMVTLLTHFQLSNKIRNLTLLIPSQSEFNNSELTLFSVSLHKLTELQTFSLEIKENNILGLASKRKLPSNKKKLNKNIINEQQQEGGKEKVSSHLEIPEKETNQSRRGISDISEALSTLKKLEKVEWIISEKNDLNDSGWEMLSRSTSLRELRIRIGEGCKFSDEGLHSLSKINSNIPLECLHFELGQGNETTDRGWGSFLSSINPKKLQNFKLAIGLDNEYSDKSLENFAVVTLENLVNLEYCTLNLQGTISSNSNSFLQIAKSLQSCTQLKLLHLQIPEESFISDLTLSSLSNSLEKMSYLKDLRLQASIEDSLSLFDQMKLSSVICSISNLVFLQLKLKGKLSTQIQGYHNFTEKNDNVPKTDELLQFRTQKGFNFKKSFIPVTYPKQFVDVLADSLALLPPDTTVLKFGLKQLNPSPSLLQIVNKLGTIKKCIVLKLNYGDNFLDEITMDELAKSISTMHFLTKLSLKANIETLSFSAAKALSSLLQQNERILKLKLILKSSITISQTQAQFLLLSATVSCPNLRKVNIDITSYSKIKLQIEQKVADPCQLSLMLDEEFQKQQPIILGNYGKYRTQKLPLKTSLFSYVQSEEHPDNQDDQMIHLADFVNQSGILQKIEIIIFSQMFISTQFAQILHEGIKKQAFLDSLVLILNEKCRISGEGIILITKALKLLKRVSSTEIVFQTDQSFSFLEALQVMINMLINQNSNNQIRKDYLDIFGGKVLISSKLSNDLKQLIQIRPISHQYIYQQNGVESLKETTISQVLAQINEIQNITFLQIDTSKLHQEGIDEWKGLESLQSLTSLSITEESPSYSTRFYSLHKALSKMINLDTLKLRLTHIDKSSETNYQEKVESVPSFGKNLRELHNLTTLTLDLTNFVFGQHGAKELSQNLAEMNKLQVITLLCVENSDLPLDDIYLLCQSTTKQASIIQSQLSIKATETTPESDIFNILNKQKLNMVGLNKESFIKINGNISQTIGQLVSSYHEKNTDSVYFNSSDMYHSYQFPKDYKILSIDEKEARQQCMQLLQLQFNSQKGILRSITVKFNTQNTQIEDSILIFLQTLFLFLKQEDQQLQKLIILLNENQNSQFGLIIEEALKHLVRVDSLQIYFSVPFLYGNIFNDLRQISKIKNLINLNINITQINSIYLKLLRTILLRKLKRLVTLQINVKKLDIEVCN